jgi:hypothetical protein
LDFHFQVDNTIDSDIGQVGRVNVANGQQFFKFFFEFTAVKFIFALSVCQLG